jgi:hypothetical protein
MDSKTKMKIIDDITNDISEKLGRLTTEGFFTFEESVKLIKYLSDKEYEWMKKNFSDMEIYEFMRNKNNL